MSAGILRAAIVGASSLLGKDLAEELNQSAAVQWDLKLLDSDDAAGQITSAADEALLIQPVSAESFLNVDVVFFVGDAAATKEHWTAAIESGAVVVDLTQALEGEQGVDVRSPLVLSEERSKHLDLASVAVVSAHPAAIMLGAVLSKLQAHFAPFQASATILEPASQYGSAGLDELHEQTVSLLSFKALPQQIFDSQVAFNLSAELGEAAKADLSATTETMRRHLALITGSSAVKSTATQFVQAPVFSGYTASIFVLTASPMKAIEVERALAGDSVTVTDPGDAPPSNQSAAQQGLIQVRVRSSEGRADEPNGFWLWIAADNLRLASRNAVACAAELLALRPTTPVQ